jgi:4,5-DOPA dioxygenase extradiol
MQLQELYNATSSLSETATMPLLFVGHGSPMNAIEKTAFTNGWNTVANEIPKPNAIVCVSAHWQTKGTFLTAMEHPKTIHDFYGFPQELFDVEYPAPGNPALAKETKSLIQKTDAELDETWGLDHGCWSVVKNMYPNADIPVIQMSMDYTQSPLWHYELAKDLVSLRKKGILIIGSGNLVHNLRMMNWHSPDKGFDWAEEANHKIKNLVLQNEHQQLADYQRLGNDVQLSVPTPEHYLPLLYVLGLKEKNEQVSFFNDKTVYGSISMTSLLIS